MHAKVSRHGLRFFAHAPGAPTCALALETIAHHLLKLELANAARAAGVHAEMEVRGPDGAWRADVMASDPGGAWRWALEAQLAPITPLTSPPGLSGWALMVCGRSGSVTGRGCRGSALFLRCASRGPATARAWLSHSALMKFDWGRRGRV